MARLNNSLKFFVVNASIIFAVIGTFILGFAMYLMIADFGTLERDFFLGIGLLLALFGIYVVLTSCLGCQGVTNQNKKFGWFWTGRKMLGSYLSLILLTLVTEVYVLTLCLQAAGEFRAIVPDLQDGREPSYVALERALEEKFNLFFFGATSECDNSLYGWFWDWVNNNCSNELLHQSNCERCESYDVTFCAADQDTCFSESDGDGRACPYTLCREDLLDYVSRRIEPVSIAVLCLVVVQLLLVLAAGMIVCFTPRDDLEKILIKSGTLSTAGATTIAATATEPRSTR